MSGTKSIRYVNESVGAFVLLGLVISLLAFAQAGRFGDLFTPRSELRIFLPDTGFSGLRVGDDVVVAGTDVGRVVVLARNEARQFFADVEIDKMWEDDIRADSAVSIRRTLAIAGRAFIEISRGEGAELDWTRATLIATPDEAPTDALAEIRGVVERLQGEILPLIENTNRAVVVWTEVGERVRDEADGVGEVLANVRDVTGRVAAGEGVAGRLIGDEALVEELEGIIGVVREAVEGLRPVIARLDVVTEDAAVVSSVAREQMERVPEILERVEESLGVSRAMLEEARAAIERVPAIAEGVNETTDRLPGLALQLQTTIAELELLIMQLRSNWLLGGSGGDWDEGTMSPVEQVP